jgi:predicted secreted acid phosphatase
MRTRAKLALALALVLLLVAAVPTFGATTPTGKTAEQIRAYYSSGLWQRAVKKQANKAKAYLIKRTHGRHAAKKPALVLDIDETSLNNYPCLNQSGGIPYSPVPYAVCVVAYNAPAVNPVRSLFRLAKEQGVKVFFITGRPEAIRAGTLTNLTASGYRGNYELILQPPGYTDPSMVPYKSGARKQIQQRGFTILANVGDQQSDLNGGYSERTYKLPNPIYLTQ